MERIPEAGDITSTAVKAAQFDGDNLTGKEEVMCFFLAILVVYRCIVDSRDIAFRQKEAVTYLYF